MTDMYRIPIDTKGVDLLEAMAQNLIALRTVLRDVSAAVEKAYVYIEDEKRDYAASVTPTINQHLDAAVALGRAAMELSRRWNRS